MTLTSAIVLVVHLCKYDPVLTLTDCHTMLLPEESEVTCLADKKSGVVAEINFFKTDKKKLRAGQLVQVAEPHCEVNHEAVAIPERESAYKFKKKPFARSPRT